MTTKTPTAPAVAEALDSPDPETTVGYQPGLLVAVNGQVGFIPAGDPQTTSVPLFDPPPPVLTYAPISTLARFKDWLPTRLSAEERRRILAKAWQSPIPVNWK